MAKNYLVVSGTLSDKTVCNLAFGENMLLKDIFACIEDEGIESINTINLIQSEKSLTPKKLSDSVTTSQVVEIGVRPMSKSVGRGQLAFFE